jgi:hypothetical protein
MKLNLCTTVMIWDLLCVFYLFLKFGFVYTKVCVEIGQICHMCCNRVNSVEFFEKRYLA